MVAKNSVICIGSVLWDVVGRTDVHPGLGGDVGGRIRRLPGGVAMIIAMTFARMGIQPVLLTAIGRDDDGEDLIARAERMGMNTDYVFRPNDLPTDIYMAIECGQRGLIAAIADAHSLEAAGAEILTPLFDGKLGSSAQPYGGTIALDGNLTAELLAQIAAHPALTNADLRIAPASPGKADRLKSLADHPAATLYVNLEEAQTICGSSHQSSESAAKALVEMGFSRAMVSDGARLIAISDRNRTFTANPPKVTVRRITGAGDTLMAGHIAAELDGAAPKEALDRAIAVTAEYISKSEN